MPAHPHLMHANALMARYNAHRTRLSHNRKPRLWDNASHLSDHRRRALAADLFVIADCQMHRELTAYEMRHIGQCERDEALHIAGPAPEQFASLCGHAAFAQDKGVCAPILALYRHNIAMAR